MSDMAKEGTTTFITDSTVQEQVFNNTNEQTGILPVRDQSISDFMAKPQLLTHLSWTTSQTPNTELFTYAPETALSAFPIYAEKLKGFNLVRGTAVFRFVLNAEPFHAGKLISSFIPVYEQLASAKFRTSCLNQRTQQPNVEMDCRDATAVFKIPYIAPTDYYEPSDDTIGWGRMFLSILSPLVTGSSGSNNVKVSVFIHFEDWEMAAPIYPQSNSPYKMKARPARSFAMSVQDREAKIMSTGTVSSGLLFASDVATALSEIPVLSSLAEPASWVARGLAHVASWFGWSKPQLDSPQDVASRRLIPYMANATGATTAPKLALYHDNQLEVMPFMAGKDADEMSFEYLKGVKAFCSRFTLTTSQASDTTLYTQSLSPILQAENLTFVGTTHNNLARSFPPYGYLARHFRYWRGGLRMHVKIAKTDYHSGRIVVVYSPKMNSASPVTVANTTYSLREVIDIRGKSEFTLDLPYLLNTPYLSVDDAMGEVSIMIVNELRAPETCAQSIEFLVYYSACPDFELAVPGSIVSTDLEGNTPNRALPYYPQMGGAQADVDQEVIDEVIGNYPKPSHSLQPSRECIGEIFTSIKQLMNRYSPIQTPTLPSTGAGGLSEYYPFQLSGLWSAATTGAPNLPSVFGDSLSDYAPGFAFFRGGIRVFVCGYDGATTPIITATINPASNEAVSIVTSSPPRDVVAQVGNPYENATCDNTPLQVHDGLGFAEVAIPYQCRTHMTIVDPYDQIPGLTPTGFSNPNTRLQFGWPGIATKSYKLRRSTTDEFQLAYFLGFPLILDQFIVN